MRKPERRVAWLRDVLGKASESSNVLNSSQQKVVCGGHPCATGQECCFSTGACFSHGDLAACPRSDLSQCVYGQGSFGANCVARRVSRQVAPPPGHRSATRSEIKNG